MNSVVVDRLANHLRRQGVEVWLDRERLSAGERWRDAIRNAIQSGALFVCCFSAGYAARTRYPHSEAISESQVDDAIRIAEAVVTWATPLVPIPRRRS